MDVYGRLWMAPRAGFEVTCKYAMRKSRARAAHCRTPSHTPTLMTRRYPSVSRRCRSHRLVSRHGIAAPTEIRMMYRINLRHAHRALRHWRLLATIIGVTLTGSAIAGETCELSSGGDGGATVNPDASDSLACGQNSTATNVANNSAGATAIGARSQATADNSTALGAFSGAEGIGSVAVGHSAIAAATNTTSIGNSSVAEGFNSTAVGNNSNSIGDDSATFGFNAVANEERTTALGVGSSAGGISDTAIGFSARANNDASVALGGAFDRNGDGAINENERTIASGRFAT
jgi:hypothetical protein